MTQTQEKPSLNEMLADVNQALKDDPTLRAEVFGPPKGGTSNIEGGEFVKKNKEFFAWRMIKTSGRKVRRGFKRVTSNTFVRALALVVTLGAVFVGLVFAIAQLYAIAPIGVYLLAAGMLAQIIASLVAYAVARHADRKWNRDIPTTGPVVPDLTGVVTG